MSDPIRARSEIEQEVVRLRMLMPSVRHFSSFNDNNWDAIEAQAKVLEGAMDRDEIYTTWPDEDELYVLDSALEAQDWASGESDSRPSNGWDELMR